MAIDQIVAPQPPYKRRELPQGPRLRTLHPRPARRRVADSSPGTMSAGADSARSATALEYPGPQIPPPTSRGSPES